MITLFGIAGGLCSHAVSTRYQQKVVNGRIVRFDKWLGATDIFMTDDRGVVVPLRQYERLEAEERAAERLADNERQARKAAEAGARVKEREAVVRKAAEEAAENRKRKAAEDAVWNAASWEERLRKPSEATVRNKEQARKEVLEAFD